MFEPDDQGISSWPAGSRPFVRASMDDGEVAYGRAARWKGRLVCVDFPAPADDIWGRSSAWLYASQLERVPGGLPECANARSGGDDPEVIWQPDRCAWPRS